MKILLFTPCVRDISNNVSSVAFKFLYIFNYIVTMDRLSEMSTVGDFDSIFKVTVGTCVNNISINISPMGGLSGRHIFLL